MPDHDDDGEVSAAVGLLRDFVNTREPQVGTEELSTPDALRDWCLARGLVPAGTTLQTADLERALDFREGLRAVLMAHAGHDPDPAALQRLNQLLAQLPLGLRFDGEGYRLTPLGDEPVAHAFAELADAVRQCSEDQTWQRLKVCARDSCRWAFYDASRNRVRRWCSMAGCGNHVKMKRAYARRTGASGRQQSE